MKKNLIISGFMSAMVLVAVTFYSCKKDNASDDTTGVTDEQVGIVQDQIDATASYDEASSEVDNTVSSQFGGVKSAEFDSGYCKPTITVDPITKNVFPKTITIDYGTLGCDNHGNGRVKSGKIIIVIDKNPLDSGASQTVTFVDFKINSKLIEGTRTSKYLGVVNGKKQWEEKLTGGKITFRDGTTLTHEFDKLKTLESGSFLTKDAVISTTDYNNTPETGVNRKGKAFSKVIVDPLIRVEGCKHIKSGSVEITVTLLDGSTKVITVTYDNPNCEGKVKIKEGKKMKDIIIQDNI